MELTLYPLLGTQSRRALLKRRRDSRIWQGYTPRGDLLERLAAQTGMTMDEVVEQLHREREYLLKQKSSG